MNNQVIKIPLKKAFFLIFGITLFISGLPTLFFLYYKHVQKERIHDSKYQILALIQTSSEKEPLKSVYLAELLNLSADSQSNIYLFNTKLAETTLRRSPLIKSVHVKKILPSTISIHYQPRVPIAFLTDFTNTAIDNNLVIIPFKPFFTPKILPEIYLGLCKENNAFNLGEKLTHPKALLAFELLNYISTQLTSETSKLKRIDVSEADASSFGQKEIVVVIEDKIEKTNKGAQALSYRTRILRLASDDYEKSFSNYLTIQKYLMEKENLEKDLDSHFSNIIDLRIPELGFIKKF